MDFGKAIIWTILFIGFLGMFFKGWFSSGLWEQIFIGMLALGSGLMVYKEVH